MLDAVVALWLVVLLLGLNYPMLDMPHFWDSLTFVAGAHALLDAGFKPLLPAGEDYGHPVLVLEVLALAWRIFGESVRVAHVVMIGFAFVAALYTYLVGRLVYGWQTGLIAATLFLFFPLVRAQSSLVLLDLPAAALGVAATYYLVRRSTRGYVLAASAMVLAKATSIVLIPAVLIYVMVTRQFCPKRALGVSLTLHCIPVLVLGVWFAFHVSVTGWIAASDNLGWLEAPDGSVFAVFINQARSSLVTQSYIGLVTLFIIVDAIVKHRSRPLSPDRGIGVLVVVPIVLQLGLMSVTTAQDRYLLPQYPLFFVAGAAAILATLKDVPLIAGALLGLILVFIVSWSRPSLGPALASPSTGGYLKFVDVDRAASAFLESHYADNVVLAGWPQYVQLAMPEQGYVTRPFRVVAPVGNLARHLVRLEALGGRGFMDSDTVGPSDFDVLYYSAHGHPADVAALESIVRRVPLTRVAEFSADAQYVAIYVRPELTAAASSTGR
jgi:4-amino-4-deoxy-L-arabinose transferase-like glycosyltransferase